MLKLQVRDQLMMRNKIRQILWLLCCLPVLTGCIGEDDYANDPRGNFEQLWKIIDEQYCFLDTKGIDWDAVHDEYSKLIIPSMSNDDLFDILSQMLYILKDGHVNLSSASRISYYDAWYQGYPWNYREDILYNYYLGSANSGYRTSAGLKYKIFDNNIGYIRYESFSAGVGDGNDNVAFLQLAAGAVHRLRAVEEVGRRAGGREERGSVPRHMAGLSDAGHMDAVSRGAAFLNERDRVFVCLRRLLREKRAEFLFRGRGQMRERGFSFVFHLLSSSNCAKRS